VHERPGCVTRPRMNHDAGGLVDNQQMLVLVYDPEGHLLGLDPGDCSRRGLELDLLPTLEPVALRTDDAVHANRALGQQALRRRPRADIGKLGQEAVEPSARRLVRNADRAFQERAAAVVAPAVGATVPRGG
jgi:hypothetical protein